MKKIIIASLIVVVFSVGYFLWKNRENAISNRLSEKKSVVINGQKISVETADTQTEREQGLSGRTSLCSGCGMLFIFDKKGIYPFWMKGMNFNLDMLWIDGSKIVQIDKNIPHAGGVSEIRKPATPIDKVLEINAGVSDKLNIKAGDGVNF